MRRILLTVLVSLTVILTLLIIRWTTLPELEKGNIFSDISEIFNSKRYYYTVTNIDDFIADFEEIDKIVIYNGFFSFDDVIKTETILDSLSQLINEKILKEELDHGRIEGNFKAHFYGMSGNLIGVATEKDGTWELLIDDGIIHSDEINNLLNKYK